MVWEQVEVKHGRGYVYAIEYHIVWSVKYRHKVLVGDIPDYLRQLLVETAIQYGFRIETLEIVSDHVHALVSTTPQHTIPNIVKVLKGVSARKLFLKFPELKNRLWGGHLWNPSYFVATVSENTEAQVKRYIENQNVSPESV
jgi:putative transposase